MSVKPDLPATLTTKSLSPSSSPEPMDHSTTFGERFITAEMFAAVQLLHFYDKANWFTYKFEDPKTEKRFLFYLNEHYGQRIATSILVFIAAYITFSLINESFSSSVPSIVLVIVGLFLMIIIFICFCTDVLLSVDGSKTILQKRLSLSRMTQFYFQQISNSLVHFLIFFLLIIQHTLTKNLGTNRFIIYYMSVLLAISALGFTLNTYFAVYAWLCWLLWIIFIVSSPVNDLSNEDIVFVAFFIFFAQLLVHRILRKQERKVRLQFLQYYREHESLFSSIQTLHNVQSLISKSNSTSNLELDSTGISSMSNTEPILTILTANEIEMKSNEKGDEMISMLTSLLTEKEIMIRDNPLSIIGEIKKAEETNAMITGSSSMRTLNSTTRKLQRETSNEPLVHPHLTFNISRNSQLLAFMESNIHSLNVKSLQIMNSFVGRLTRSVNDGIVGKGRKTPLLTEEFGMNHEIFVPWMRIFARGYIGHSMCYDRLNNTSNIYANINNDNDNDNDDKNMRYLSTFNELPVWYKFNDYILDGYRLRYSLSELWMSAFEWHNETSNVWTEIIPGILLNINFFILLFIHPDFILLNPAMHFTNGSRIIIGLGTGVFLIRPFLSAYAHLLHAHSSKYYSFVWTIDFISIIITAFMTSVMWIHIIFQCHIHAQVLFNFCMIGFTITAMVVVIQSQESDVRDTVLTLFVFFTEYFVFFFHIYQVLSQTNRTPLGFTLLWALSLTAALIGGAFRYSSFPESMKVKQAVQSLMTHEQMSTVITEPIVYQYMIKIAKRGQKYWKDNWWSYICNSHDIWHIGINSMHFLITYAVLQYLHWYKDNECE